MPAELWQNQAESRSLTYSSKQTLPIYTLSHEPPKAAPWHAKAAKTNKLINKQNHQQALGLQKEQLSLQESFKLGVPPAKGRSWTPTPCAHGACDGVGCRNRASAFRSELKCHTLAHGTSRDQTKKLVGPAQHRPGCFSTGI